MTEGYTPSKRLPIVNGLPTHYIAQVTPSPNRATIELSSANTQGVTSMETETHPQQAEAAPQESRRQLGHLALYEAPEGVQDPQGWDQTVQPYFGE